MEQNIFALMQAQKQKQELTAVLSCNEKTGRFALSLTTDDAKKLVACRDKSLQSHRRVELGSGILDQLIFEFCDSPYIWQDIYLETLERLQDIFYFFKNASRDKLTDEEILTYMHRQFDGPCGGDLDYLEYNGVYGLAAEIRKSKAQRS